MDPFKFFGRDANGKLNGKVNLFGENHETTELLANGASQGCAGTVLGFCSGYLARTAFKGAVVVGGLGFVSLQALNYYGYVDVKWNKVTNDIQNTLDINNDGVVDQKDFKVLSDQAMRVLAKGLPSTAGFSLGLYYGLRTKL
eukprot:GHVN01075043.1.p1 GENE.GHVN01075043.1~~GHVN01075043.1.p1  ORF type:complete len:142 (+),score=10.20 GHVN01075043.1:148-573(+)